MGFFSFRCVCLLPTILVGGPESRWQCPKLDQLLIDFWMQLCCLQLEASCLQWRILLTIEAFPLTAGDFYLQWESASSKHLMDSKQKKLNCKQKNSTVSKEARDIIITSVGKFFCCF